MEVECENNVRAEAERRREPHRQAAAAALARMRARGMTIAEIALLKRTSTSAVRAYLKFGRATS
jgi:hypothetical protein